MNLINCAEACVYQKEGYCCLDGEAPVSAVRVNGCCYFRPIHPAVSSPPLGALPQTPLKGFIP